ncbi:hypothetical protein ACFO4N_06705 [Camelliibacillus cellulosilyticus]|uniref:Uncharacterized protein n=1 Tax=Camelliibacillus cellulosilyticus TaxID=2174486 RepID=A0ABV9GNB4_9BACL
MAKLIREIQMEDYTISLKEHNDGHFEAKLSSGSHGGLLVLEKLENDHLRIHDVDIGGADVSLEHLAIMLTLLGADGPIIKEIDRINKKRKQIE